VVPVSVTGTNFLYPFRRIEVSIGQAIRPDPPAWWALSQRAAAVVENVRRALMSGLQRRRKS